jgi:predicted  nucleic acid-binding Zn-ribbon protein
VALWPGKRHGARGSLSFYKEMREMEIDDRMQALQEEVDRVVARTTIAENALDRVTVERNEARRILSGKDLKIKDLNDQLETCGAFVALVRTLLSDFDGKWEELAKENRDE